MRQGTGLALGAAALFLLAGCAAHRQAPQAAASAPAQADALQPGEDAVVLPPGAKPLAREEEEALQQ